MRSSIIVAGAAAALLLAGLVVVGPLSGISTPLTWNLGGGTWTVLTERFTARLQQAFPVGSSERQTMIELERQGFSVLPAAAADANERQAVRREDNLVCNIVARVYWRTDAGGRLVAIRGVYREEGCL